jgi:hypothetical protein
MFAREPFREHAREKELFLAGPTPRTDETESWRPDALKILFEQQYRGTVILPEDKDCGLAGMDDEALADAQQRWETIALDRADVILFWIPRDLVTMPGFRTNIEYGAYKDSGKIVVGAPAGAAKMSSIRRDAHIHGFKMCETLEETVKQALVLMDAIWK